MYQKDDFWFCIEKVAGQGDEEEVIAVIKWGGGLDESCTVEMKKRE